MPTILKRKYLYLYLAIACFVALVAIFVVDAYMGIYDTFYITVKEYTQKIEADYWLQQYPYDTPEYPYSTPESGNGDVVTYCCISAKGDKIDFRYEIANHRFTNYSTHINASVWQQNEKIIDLLSDDISVAPFDEAIVEWELINADLENTSFIGPSEQNQYAQCTVRISHGEIERRIIIDFYYQNSDLIPPEKYY